SGTCRRSVVGMAKRGPLLGVVFATILALQSFLMASAEASPPEMPWTKLSSLQRDLASGKIAKMAVLWRDESREDLTGIIDPGVFNINARYRCQFAMFPAFGEQISDILKKTDVAVPTEIADLFWGVEFYDAQNELLHTLYMGRWYKNISVVIVIIDHSFAEVSVELVKWFKTHVDIERCRIG